MRALHRVALIAAAVAAVATTALASAGPALADPTSPQPYTAVGSRATQDVLAALAGQPIVPPGTVPPPAGTLTSVGSYEATPRGTNITPKCGVTFPRPYEDAQAVRQDHGQPDPDDLQHRVGHDHQGLRLPGRQLLRPGGHRHGAYRPVRLPALTDRLPGDRLRGPE
jgi:hypothetical protein